MYRVGFFSKKITEKVIIPAATFTGIVLFQAVRNVYLEEYMEKYNEYMEKRAHAHQPTHSIPKPSMTLT